MSFDRYTTPRIYPEKDPTKSILMSSLVNGGLYELMYDSTTNTFRWGVDRTIFAPTERSYGGIFPFVDPGMNEYGALYCRYQDSYDSYTTRRSYTSLDSGGGVTSLTKIAPLYDLASLMLAADATAGSVAGLSYSANGAEWSSLQSRDCSLSFYFKVHKQNVDGAKLEVHFAGATNLGVKLERVSGVWKLYIVFGGVETVVTDPTITLDRWHYLTLNKAISSGTTSFGLRVDGTALYSGSVSTPTEVTYTAFEVKASGTGFSDSLPSASSTGTSFMLSNLRVDVNNLKTTHVIDVLTENPYAGGTDAFPYDLTAQDPHYSKVTLLMRSDRSSPFLSYNMVTSIPGMHDVTGHNVITGTLSSLVTVSSGYNFAHDPASIDTGYTTQGSTAQLNKFGAYTTLNMLPKQYTALPLSLVKISQRDCDSLTFSGDFTFELWAHPTKASRCLLSTASGITINNGNLTGIGSTISLGGYGVTTGLGAWSHIALSRVGTTLRVFINAVKIAEVTHSGTVSFNDLDLGVLNTGDANNHFEGQIGQVRATKGVGRYVTNSDVISAVYNNYTRLEYPDEIVGIYDEDTDYVYCMVSWVTDGLFQEPVRLELVKYDPRLATVVQTLPLWVKTNGSQYHCPYSIYTITATSEGTFSTLSSDTKSWFSIMGPYIMLTKNQYEYELFNKADLTLYGTYPSRYKSGGSSDNVLTGIQHKRLVYAGQDRFFTWADPLGTSDAVLLPKYGNVVLHLQFNLEQGDGIWRDVMGHKLTPSGITFPGGRSSAQVWSGVPHGIIFDSQRTGSVTVESSGEFAFLGDFTIEMEAQFVENTAGPISPSTTFYQQSSGGTGISLTANGLTLTANVFGSVLSFAGTGSGTTATFGAIGTSDQQLAKIHHITITRTSGDIRLFLNGVLAQKVTGNNTAGVASTIVLGTNMRGKLSEVIVYNGYSRRQTDASFTPERYTATTAFGIPIQHKAFPLTNSVVALPVNGLVPNPSSLIMARKSRRTPKGKVVFDQLAQSPTFPFTTGRAAVEGVIYHPVHDKVWVFANATTMNGAGTVCGAIWDFNVNTFTNVTLQGNATEVVGTSFVYKFNTISATNATADFGKAVNYGGVINQGLARSPYWGSLFLTKAANQYVRAPVLSGATFSTGNWTVELWYYNGVLQAETTPDVLISEQTNTTPRFEIRVDRSATSCLTGFRAYNGVGIVEVPSLGSPSQDIATGWSHIVILRNSDKIQGWTNGVKTHELTLSSAGVSLNGTMSQAYIGCSSFLTKYARGRIQEVRLTNNLARYTATFTPPTLPFELQGVSSTPSLVVNKVWAYGNDVIVAAAISSSTSIGSGFQGAYRFNSSGTLIATYGFVGFNDDVNAYTGVTPLGNMWLLPRHTRTLASPGGETHALYMSATSSEQPIVFMWDLDNPSILPSRKIQYSAQTDPTNDQRFVPFGFVKSGSPALSNMIGVPTLMLGLDTDKWFWRGVPMRSPVGANTIIGLDFEDVLNGPAVPVINSYGNVGVGSTYSALGFSFGAEAFIARSYLYGGSAQFGARSEYRLGEAALTFTGSTSVISSTSSFTAGLSFYLASSAAVTVELYSGANATGGLVGSQTFAATGTCSLVDPNDVYCTWNICSVTASSSFRSVKLTYTASSFFIDNLTFGSLTPTALGVIPINGSNVAPTYTVVTPTATALSLPDDISNGVITGDFTQPTTDPVVTEHPEIFNSTGFTSAVKWFSFVHDGSKTLKINPLQANATAPATLQGGPTTNTVFKYITAALYNSDGKLIQRPYKNEEYLHYIGMQTTVTSAATVPFAAPLIVPKTFPTGTYYIGVTLRTPGADRNYETGSGGLWTGRNAPLRTRHHDFAFGATSGAPDAGRWVPTATPVVTIGAEVFPPVDTTSATSITTSGVAEGTLTHLTSGQLAGVGSLRSTLSVGGSQELPTDDSYYLGYVLILAKLNNNFTDTKGSAIFTSSGSFTTGARFGTHALASGGATWTLATTQTAVDRSAYCIDGYMSNTGNTFSSTYTLFTTRMSNTAGTHFIDFLINRNSADAGLFRLQVRLFDSLGHSGYYIDQTSSGFTLPYGQWLHFALIKSAQVADVSTVKLAINGLELASVSLSVPTNYLTDITRVQLSTNNLGALDDFRLTADSRYTLPFTPPHWSFPTQGGTLPPPTPTPAPGPTLPPTMTTFFGERLSYDPTPTGAPLTASNSFDTHIGSGATTQDFTSTLGTSPSSWTQSGMTVGSSATDCFGDDFDDGVFYGLSSGPYMSFDYGWTLTFPTPIAGFGAYFTSPAAYTSNQMRLVCTKSGGGTVTITVPVTTTGSGRFGALVFFGFTDTGQTYTQITFDDNGVGNLYCAMDNLRIMTAAQLV